MIHILRHTKDYDIPFYCKEDKKLYKKAKKLEDKIDKLQCEINKLEKEHEELFKSDLNWRKCKKRETMRWLYPEEYYSDEWIDKLCK